MPQGLNKHELLKTDSHETLRLTQLETCCRDIITIAVNNLLPLFSIC